MARELEFDGYWEGEVFYICDCCKKRVKKRFDGEDDANDFKGQKALLKAKGWIFTKVNGRWADFCSERCRNKFIRKNTI